MCITSRVLRRYSCYSTRSSRGQCTQERRNLTWPFLSSTNTASRGLRLRSLSCWHENRDGTIRATSPPLNDESKKSLKKFKNKTPTVKKKKMCTCVHLCLRVWRGAGWWLAFWISTETPHINANLITYYFIQCLSPTCIRKSFHP